MKIRVVSSRKEIFTLNPQERIVHMAFRPSNKDIFELVKACPKIEAIQLPKSYFNNVSKSIGMFLKIQRIQLLQGDVWGHRKDMDEYYNVPSSVFTVIREMKHEGKSTADIENEVSKKNKINHDMVGYILSKEAHV